VVDLPFNDWRRKLHRLNFGGSRISIISMLLMSVMHEDKVVTAGPLSVIQMNTSIADADVVLSMIGIMVAEAAAAGVKASTNAGTVGAVVMT